MVQFHARDLCQHLKHKVPALTESLLHLPDLSGVGGSDLRHQSCPLGDGTGSRSELSLQLVACFCNFKRSRDITDSPPGHGKSF